MTRFGLLIGSPKIGGAERQVRLLAQGLRASGHQAKVYFLERAGRRAPEAVLDFSEVPHAHVGHGRARGWWSRPRFRRMVRSDRIECLLAFNVDAMEFAAATLAELPGLALVGSIRGLGFDRRPELVRRLHTLAGIMTPVTCNSIAIERALVSNGVCAAEDVMRLPNIVELPARASAGSIDGPTVLFVGNLIEVKRPELFVQACRIALTAVPELRVLVVGDGPLAAAARQATGDASDRFTFCGHLAPAAVPYARADLVVNTSRREGSSNVLLEAMAHGLPVVAARAGGNEDLVESSAAGILVDSDRPEDFAQAIVSLATSAEQRRRLGARGRRFIEEHHALPSVVHQLERIVDAARARSPRG